MRSLLLIALLAGSLHADVLSDMQAATSKRQQRAIDRGAKPSVAARKAPSAAKARGIDAIAAAANSYADIRSSAYNFEWLLPSGGWYWDSDTSYSTFDVIFQEFNDISTFEATISLLVFNGSPNPQTLAQGAVDDASLEANYAANAEVYDTTFADNPAFYNSYAYTSSGFDWSYDQWYFINDGVTYLFEIFTTLDDWNANGPFYLTVAEVGVTFNQTGAAKQANQETSRPKISYFPTLDGRTQFTANGFGTDIYIYDVNGRLVRSLSGTNIWDGKDVSGSTVGTGFYVSNVKTPQGIYRMKMLKK